MINEYTFDGLRIEELRWQLPGRPTEAIVLKPENSVDAAGNTCSRPRRKQVFRNQKDHADIQQTASVDGPSPERIEGFAWANEIAKRGYVLVSDAFPAEGDDEDILHRDRLRMMIFENPVNIEVYNRWASIMSTYTSRSSAQV